MSNIYTTFLSLVPRFPLQVGDVLAYSDGIATIELPGGGLLQVRGDATVGQRVFVRNGAIEGEAPTLPIDVIEV